VNQQYENDRGKKKEQCASGQPQHKSEMRALTAGSLQTSSKKGKLIGTAPSNATSKSKTTVAANTQIGAIEST